jgi:hypothetical protein
MDEAGNGIFRLLKIRVKTSFFTFRNLHELTHDIIQIALIFVYDVQFLTFLWKEKSQWDGAYFIVINIHGIQSTYLDLINPYSIIM